MTSLVPRTTRLPVETVRPRRDPQWLLNQLPVGMAEEEFFARFVSIFQALGDTLLADADNIDNVCDVTVAPPELVRWLGSWIGTTAIDPSIADELQRRIVAGAASTLTWRGTAKGLRHFLELTSGGPAAVRDGGGVWAAGDLPADTAWVQMFVRSTGWVSEVDFIELVRDEIPAHVRAELWVDERCVWASEEES
jgi:phage tail-like protein